MGQDELYGELYGERDGEHHRKPGGERSGEAFLGEIASGESVGEVALLTASLRSASVRALTNVTALSLRRDQLSELMARFPSVAEHFLAVLSTRLASADRVLARLLDPANAPATPLVGLDRQTREIAVQRRPLSRLLRRAFQELVVEHRRELPFFLLSGFLAAFLAARLAVAALGGLGVGLEPALRCAYVGGIVLLLGTAGLAPFVYRRPLRRLLCLTFGIGAGLIVNELSVWLAFDVFYRDIFTRDPSLVFDPALLYRRSVTRWVFCAIALALAQATYLSQFYRRSYYLLREWLAARVFKS